MWYLCVFFHRLLDYRKPEVESLAELFGAFEDNQNGDFSSKNRSLEWKLPPHHHPDSPFHFVNLPSEEVARNIANRSILVKGMYELWGEGGSYEELKDSILSYPDERKLPYLDSNSTFKITVDTFGKVMSFQEQKELIQGLSYIPFKHASTSAAIVAVCVQHFITAMDSLKLNMVAVDQLHPLLVDVYGSLNQLSYLPPDFEAQIKMKEWIARLSKMGAAD